MRVSDYHFDLPDELIARYPVAQRTASRLLHLNATDGSVSHGVFTDIETLLQAGDLLVFNNTKVLPARVFGQKVSGGKLELLIERLLNPQEALAHIKCSKSPQVDSRIVLGTDQGEAIQAKVLGRQEGLFHLAFEEPIPALLERIGHIPLPPYIGRPDELADQERYQTVYAQKPGAVAAPTAGLHFDQALISRLQKKGVKTAFVTLHVGAGTFQPIRVTRVEDHQMHGEYVEVEESVVEQIRATKAQGGRVIAVGTTSVRSLEAASQNGKLQPITGDTHIFIYPGYRFKTVDALITNFHLPESTLIMLISAFAGYRNVMNAYQTAIEKRYRFFSYGDAMFISHPRGETP